MNGGRIAGAMVVAGIYLTAIWLATDFIRLLRESRYPGKVPVEIEAVVYTRHAAPPNGFESTVGDLYLVSVEERDEWTVAMYTKVPGCDGDPVREFEMYRRGGN